MNNMGSTITGNNKKKDEYNTSTASQKLQLSRPNQMPPRRQMPSKWHNLPGHRNNKQRLRNIYWPDRSTV